MVEDVDVLLEKIRAVRAGLMEVALKAAVAAALDQKGSTAARLQAEGIPGQQYSDKGVPAYFYTGFSSIAGKNAGKTYLSSARQNSGFDKLIKDKIKKKENVAWKDIREAQGYQIEFVDLTFTGMMFRNLKIVETKIIDDKVYAYLGGDLPETKEKLSYNIERYGNFFAPNEVEAMSMKEKADDEIKKLFKKAGLV